jgi:hypothetical protein
MIDAYDVCGSVRFLFWPLPCILRISRLSVSVVHGFFLLCFTYLLIFFIPQPIVTHARGR